MLTQLTELTNNSPSFSINLKWGKPSQLAELTNKLAEFAQDPTI